MYICCYDDIYVLNSFIYAKKTTYIYSIYVALASYMLSIYVVWLLHICFEQTTYISQKTTYIPCESNERTTYIPPKTTYMRSINCIYAVDPPAWPLLM